jgi:hypothetical protein
MMTSLIAIFSRMKNGSASFAIQSGGAEDGALEAAARHLHGEESLKVSDMRFTRD